MHLLLIVEDVSEYVRLQSDLVKTERTAAVGNLVAELAEDLNNRLGPVLGHAQMLQQRKIGIGEMAHVNAIERCTQSLRRIVESLLAFARPAAPAPRPCSINDTIREACTLVEDECRTAPAPHVKFALDLDAQLPTTLADARQLTQVFLNLLNNARQAMAERGGTITATSTSDGAAIVVTIADTGEGIDPDKLERIFDPAYTTRTTRFGAGLGLTVARAIVRNHGGSIAVESKRHRGTTVRVELPVRTPSSAHPGPAGVAPDRAALPRAEAPKALRILLAEPDAEMLAMTRKLLAGAGHRTVACATADAVLDALERETFDLVVADLGMRELSGVDLHARLAAQRPEPAPRIVFTTAGICDTRTSAFIHSIGARLVTKPFNVRDLLAAIADLAASVPS